MERTANEDALLVWTMFSGSFIDFNKTTLYTSSKDHSWYIERFKQIMESKELTDRVLAETKGDVLGYKQVPWGRRESLALARLIHFNGLNVTMILSKCPSLFHPSRTASGLNSTYVRMKKRSCETLQAQKTLFRELQSKIERDVAKFELAPFPGSNDPEDALKPYQQLDEFERKQNEVKFDIKEIREKLPTYGLAYLYGMGEPRVITKCREVIGRDSPKVRPDIDLSDLGIQSVSRNHVEIRLCKDYKFYMECRGSSVIVNGVYFRRGDVIQIQNEDIIDIGGAPFVFLLNDKIFKV